MKAMQLTLDGREEAHDALAARQASLAPFYEQPKAQGPGRQRPGHRGRRARRGHRSRD